LDRPKLERARFRLDADVTARVLDAGRAREQSAVQAHLEPLPGDLDLEDLPVARAGRGRGGRSLGEHPLAGRLAMPEDAADGGEAAFADRVAELHLIAVARPA